MDAIARAIHGGKGMIRVLVGFWVTMMSLISFILCILEDDFKGKLLIAGATAIFLAVLLFGLWLIGG